MNLRDIATFFEMAIVTAQLIEPTRNTPHDDQVFIQVSGSLLLLLALAVQLTTVRVSVQ